jgi:hypothetical protein
MSMLNEHYIPMSLRCLTIAPDFNGSLLLNSFETLMLNQLFMSIFTKTLGVKMFLPVFVTKIFELKVS